MVFKHTWLFLVLALWSALLHSQSAPPEFWVVGNNTGYNVVTNRQLQNVFTGSVVILPSKKPATVVMQSSTTRECQYVADMYFKGSIPALQKFWLSQVFQGRSNPPVFVDSHQDVLEYVANHEGAIAIVFSGTGTDKWLIPRE
jgi:hypothetical protein